MKKVLSILFSIMLLAVIPSQAAQQWVTAYYTSWQTAAYPPNRIDYTTITHIVLVHWLTNANGTIQTSDWDSTCSSVVGPAHAAGAKVLMMLGGSDDDHFASAASPTYQPTLISSIQAKVSACGLDGVDLDWEKNVITADSISLAKNLRTASPDYVITVPLDPAVHPASFATSLSPYVDQLNMTTFGNANTGSGWVSWYFSALDGDGSTHPESVNKYVNSWQAAGTPAGKIGIGIGFYANGWKAPVTGPLQSIAGSTVSVRELPYGWSLAQGGGLLSCYYNQPGGTYLYDPSPDLNTEPGTPPEQPSISFPGLIADPSPCPTDPISWMTYEDEASVGAKATYIVQKSLGGAAIWTVQEGAVDPATGRNPLLEALKRKFYPHGGPAPMPPVASSGPVLVAGPTTIMVKDLPTNLGLVDINWWNNTSNAAWDNASDPGFQTYGQPSAYMLQGSTDGSSWTTLSCTPSCNVTGEHYTGRQFVADLTGTGYTRIRMKISGIVGTNAGYDVLTVNGQEGTNVTNDTYLMLGDSITANCWGGGSTQQPNAEIQYETQHIPVLTVGGQSDWSTSTALDTSTYGIPNIQKVLQDMPAVKYVGLSLGTNDANENVSAATYCANMQSIVQYIIAAGKTPIIPTIVASPSAAVQSNAPAMNACLTTLKQNYPSILGGPDLWTSFKGHSISDGWFLDNVNPSLETGCKRLRSSWAYTLMWTVYVAAWHNSIPAVPSALSVWQGKYDRMVSLSWGKSPDGSYPDLYIKYNIYRDGVLLARTQDWTNYYDYSVAPSTTYTYTVSATNPENMSSAQSAPVTITTSAFEPFSKGPSAVSVSPSSGTGIKQQFSFVASSPDGAGNLDSIYMLFNSSFVREKGCYLTYYKPKNTLTLVSDDGSTTSTSPLGAGTLSNSQCSVDLASTTVTSSGNDLTVSPTITFLSGFTSAIHIYEWVYDHGWRSSGFQEVGWWMPGTVANEAPSAVSVSPSSGYGVKQQFSFVASSPRGARNLSFVGMLLNSSLDRANGCYLTYYIAANLFTLVSSDGWTVSEAPMGTGTLSNSHCSVDLANTTITFSGSTLTVAPTITFLPGFSGTKRIYENVGDIPGLTSGMQQLGWWMPGDKPEAAPSAVSVTPSSGYGVKQQFSFVASSPNGAGNLAFVSMLFNSSLLRAKGCYLTYYTSGNTFTLVSDDGSTVTTGQLGTGTLSNSQCTVDLTQTTVTPSGNTLTIAPTITFLSGFTSAVHIYENVGDIPGLNTNSFHLLGWWMPGIAPPSAPVAVSVTPSSGQGLTQQFSFVAGSPNGAGNLAFVSMLFNDSLTNVNGCYLTYYTAIKTFTLVSDDGSSISIGKVGTGTLSNSQCSVDLANTNVTPSGNTLTVAPTITFLSGLSGATRIYENVGDIPGLTSGFHKIGSWTVGP